MKFCISFPLSIIALLLFVAQCANNTNKINEDCGCDDEGVICDPPPALIIRPIIPLPPLCTSMPKSSRIPQYEDWDTIYFCNTIGCRWDTSNIDTIIIKSVGEISNGVIYGKNTDGTFESISIFRTDNDSVAFFIHKIYDYLKSVMLKYKYYIVKNEVSNNTIAFNDNLKYYKKHNYIPVEIDLRLIPEKK